MIVYNKGFTLQLYLFSESIVLKVVPNQTLWSQSYIPTPSAIPAVLASNRTFNMLVRNKTEKEMLVYVMKGI